MIKKEIIDSGSQLEDQLIQYVGQITSNSSFVEMCVGDDTSENISHINGFNNDLATESACCKE